MSKPPKVSAIKRPGSRHVPHSIIDLLTLLERWTAVDILTRVGPQQNTCLAHRKVELEDGIRKLVFGSADLVKLGESWGVI